MKSTLASTSRGCSMSARLRVDEQPVEEPEVVLVERGAAVVEALLEGAVVLEDLLPEVVEVLRVAGLVDLLGREERLLVLVVVGHDEPGELRRHALLPDEEAGQAPRDLVAHDRVHGLPVAAVLGEVDLVGAPSSGAPTAGRARAGVMSVTVERRDSSLIVATSPWVVRSSSEGMAGESITRLTPCQVRSGPVLGWLRRWPRPSPPPGAGRSRRPCWPPPRTSCARARPTPT